MSKEEKIKSLLDATAPERLDTENTSGKINSENTSESDNTSGNERTLKSERQHKPQPNRATFIVTRESVAKLNAIAALTQTTRTSLVQGIFDSFISVWEKQNGTINLK